MKFCESCKVPCLRGSDRINAEEYVGDFVDATVWEADLTRAAELARMARVEFAGRTASAVELCLDNNQLGLCAVTPDPEAILL